MDVTIDDDVVVDVSLGVGVDVIMAVSLGIITLLALTGGNYHALGINRGELSRSWHRQGGIITLLTSSENSPNFHHHFPTLY